METPEIALDPGCRICIKHEPKQLSKNLFWGLGWGIERKDGTDALWHWGDNGSFKGFVMARVQRALLDEELIVGRLLNELDDAVSMEVAQRQRPQN